MKVISRALDYLKRNGPESTCYAAIQHLKDAGRDIGYELMIREERAKPEELARQKQEGKAFGVKISVIVPVFHPRADYLKEMVHSVLEQSYSLWELVLSDGSETPSAEAEKLAGLDERIRYVRAKEGGGISDNTNIGLNSSTGDVTAFLDQDDLLEPDALYRIAWAIKGGAQIVYTDEDKVTEDAGHHLSPYRKLDYNQDLLYGNNYICHFLAVKRSLAMGVGGFRSRYDGAQDHDFILRCTDAVDQKRIWHIPKVLYHWRMHGSSTSGNPSSKIYAYENGRRAVEDHLRKKGIDCQVKHTEHRGFFRTEYKEIPDPEPLVCFFGRNVVPLTERAKEVLSSYFVRPDVGAVGARILDRHGRILSSGYYRDEDGRAVSYFEGMDPRMPGEMNLACLVMDVDAVSKYACVVRKSLAESEGLDPGHMDSWKLCSKIRRRGYKILVDPMVLFQIRQ